MLLLFENLYQFSVFIKVLTQYLFYFVLFFCFCLFFLGGAAFYNIFCFIFVKGPPANNVELGHVIVMHLLCACAVFTTHPHVGTWAHTSCDRIPSQEYFRACAVTAYADLYLEFILFQLLPHFVVLAKNHLKFRWIITRKLVSIGLSVHL